MAFFYEKLEKKYGQAISKHVQDETYCLEYEFQNKFDNLGTIVATAEQYENLCHLEDMAKLKIKKRTNWLWYLMKTGQYQTLDIELGTDFTPRFAAIRHAPKKIRKVRSNPVLFSRCELPIDDDISLKDLEIIDEYLKEEVDQIVHNLRQHTRAERRKEFYKNMTRKDETFDHNILPSERRVSESIDSRDYDKLSMIAINLRYIIETLEHARSVCISKLKTLRLFNSKKTIDDIEMNVLKQYNEELEYQGGGSQTLVKPGKQKLPNLTKADNRPRCCFYCPTIVCMKCFKGEGCCTHQRVHYQGNVEQDVGGDSSVVQLDTAHNVVLTETEITQSDKTAQPNPGWSRFASSDVVSSMDSLVNRWFRVNTYQWTTSMSRNTTITSIDLPRAAIFQDPTTCNQPNQIPFRIHRYWRGDMIVKIHINCNKFQIGQLQCAWYYQPKADNSFSSKGNVYTRSGAHHCVISAAPNNEVELVIPFKAFKSMYHTKSFAGDGLDNPLDLGTLFITVLSPLVAAGDTSPRCSFTVFVKFINNEFTGMMAGDIDVPAQVAEEKLHYQMDGIGTVLNTAVPLVEKLLTSSLNDNNRDNPPDNRPPPYLVPTASHSWSIGTDLSEPLHNLRLSGKAQTCHPDSDMDEMRIDVLKRKYMLLDVFSWTQQNSNGALLWQMPVNPLPPKDRLYRTANAGENLLAQYQITPIGFLSSLHQYWRGSIEYRFDIVASQFHSGKLLLAYIPGVEEGYVPTLEQARASPNVVISLDNAMTYTWRVPYVADRPWWPRRYAGESVTNNMRSPSKIFVFILNELVLASNVPASLEVLVYMRGGEDMEFSIPVQPSIGVGFDRSYISVRNTDNVYPVSPTDTYYSGDWHRTPLVQVMRRATTSEAVAQFTEPILDRPAYYIISSNLPTAIVTGNTPVPISTVIILRPVYYSDYIAFPIRHIENDITSITRLEAIARAAFANNYTYGDWMSQFIATIAVPYGFINPTNDTTSNTYGGGSRVVLTATTVSPQLSHSSSYDTLEYQGNREDSLSLVDNTQSLRTTGSGMLTFGEKFTDLKDLCRRYQMYGLVTVPRINIERDPGACSFVFPVLPQGLELELNATSGVNQIWNRAREGHIPLIASLYRFYRGSLRVRIVVSNASGLVMWVQHRPDRKLARQNITPCTSVTTAEAVFNHTYGVYMQDMDVNSVVEIEVPFYQMANFGLLQKPVVNTATEWSSFYSLGELSIGFFGQQPSADVRCAIYYSLADDCRFSTFQGVPPMVLIDDLPEYQLQYQGNKESHYHEHVCNSCNSKYGHFHNFKHLNHAQYDFQCPNAHCSMFYEKGGKGYNHRNASLTKLSYQGISDFFFSSPKKIGQEMSEGAAEAIQENIQPVIQSFLGNIKEQLADTYDCVKSSLSDLEISSKLMSIASQIMHAVNNPSASTIAISIISILITFGLISYAVYTVVRDYIVTIWQWISKKVSSPEPQSEVETGEEALYHQSNTVEQNAVTGFLSILCGGLCTLFGAKNDIKYKSTSDCLFKNIDRGMKMSNVCFVFLKNLMSVIGDMKAFIVAKLYPGFNAAESLMQGRDIIEKWLSVSHDVLDPMVSQNMKYDRSLQLRLLDCYAFGKILRVKALDTQYPQIIQLINSTYDKLHKLHVDLVAQGIDPSVRKMPFTIFHYGLPEIGKSHLTTNISAQLCEDQNIKPETTLMCVLNATSKFWDDCDRQPVLVMDDAFNIRSGPMLEEQLATIFNVVSPVVLVPPKADVVDKGRRYNPEIFIMNSNEIFFKSDLVTHSEALWRRRDIILHSEIDPDFKKDGCPHCINNWPVNALLPPEAIPHLKDFHHLRFRYTFDVKNPDCEKKPECWLPTNNQWLKYDALMVILKDTFRKNRATENIKFAERVEYCNRTAGTFGSLVSNVDNLEKLWNDAIKANELRTELLRNSTWETISNSIIKNIASQLDIAKHNVLKRIYSVIKPKNNRYMLKNELCTECCRIQYQCVTCRLSLEAVMREHATPSCSNSSISELILDDPKFQGNNIQIPNFEPKISLDLNDTAEEWLHNLSKKYKKKYLDWFNEFLDANAATLILKLRAYPKYARSVSVFQQVCESLCNCVHNSDINVPYLHDGVLSFVNPMQISSPDSLHEFTCTKICYFLLPWVVHKAANVCRDKFPSVEEEWCNDFGVRKDPRFKFDLDLIFSNLVKWVYDFYYGTMKPSVKAVFSFFSTFRGWCMGLAFLSAVFTTGIYGAVACSSISDVRQGKSLVSPNPSMSANVQPSTSQTSAITEYQSKSYESGKPRVNRVARPKIKTPTKSPKLVHQSAQQFNVAESILDKNLVCIAAEYVNNEGELKVVNNYGLMIRDQQMLIQRHYYDFWVTLPITAKFYFRCNVKTIPDKGLLLPNFFDCEIDWFFNQEDQFVDSNFGLIYLPLIVPAFKNITKFIARASEHEYIKSDEVYLYNCETRRTQHCNMTVAYNKEITESTWLRLDECYSYKYTKLGLCGSILLCANLERPIIGMHFAGSDIRGYAEPMTQESFVEIESRDYDYECHDLLLEDDMPKCELETLLYPQGTIPAQHAHHQGSVSQYIPSLVQGVYEVDSEPNPLSPHDPRLPPNSSPLKLGCEHMGKPPQDFPNHLLNPAADDLKDVILATVKPVRVKIDKLSLQDAICGNVNVQGFEPLEWSSSEGFPLKALRPKNVKGKRWLFNLEESPSGYVLKGMHAELKRQLVLSDIIRKKGIRIPTIFTDCLKDTCIPKEKCGIPGKTRIFSISPVQYTIAFKQYFGDFLASYQNNRIDAEHGIGINVDSIEWTQVATYLTTYGNKIIAGDYKNYGPSLMLKCVRRAFDIIIAWYERYDPEPERQLVRRVLLSEILHSKHLCLNLVYGVPCGIPSGSPITTPLNSLVNSLYLRCAWKDITKKSFSVMRQHTRFLTYGDDVCINVSDGYVDIFNTITLNLFFKKYNIVFTDVDKSDNIIKYRTLDDVTFLKRGFLHHPNSNAIFIAPIDKQSIRKCVNWITRKGDPILNTLENCKQACELAFGHGPKYYNEVRDCLQAECLAKLGTTFISPSWYEKSEVCYGI